jgi:hypothetical protein
MKAKAVKKAATSPASQFLKAISKANLDTACVGSGLKAIKGEHRAAIKPKATRRLTGSVDMDAALSTALPHAHRWDYGVGLLLPDNKTEIAIWIEVHPATTGEVDCILSKLDWLKARLKQYVAMGKLTAKAEENNVQPFYWLPTDSGVHIHAHMPQARKLAARGIPLPVSILRLP